MRWLFACLLVAAFLAPLRAHAQADAGIRISAPASGGVLRGLVDITGTSAVDGFFASELSFAYVSDPTNTWFLIFSSDQPVTDGLLAAWDTNSVTDGDYDLRLRVILQDGTILETLVTGLRIRNQTPPETATPAPTPTPELESLPIASPLPTDQPVPTPARRLTPTPLPPNPATVTSPQIYAFLGRGIALALLSFLVIGLLLRLRR